MTLTEALERFLTAKADRSPRTIDWYRENEGWWRPLRQGVYGGERLGLFPDASSSQAPERAG